MMARISFIKENISVEIEENITLLDAIRSVGLTIETPCNGVGFCGKCKVIAIGQLSDPTDDERKFINIDKNERLSCVTRVIGDVKVELIDSEKVLKTINKGYSINVLVDSSVKSIKLPEIDKQSSQPYKDYLGYDFNSIGLYQKISMIESNRAKEIWGVIFDEELLDIGENPKKILGVAVDIGTTGISYYLIDLSSGELIEELSSLNPQTQYGGDVLTRITYCMENQLGPIKLQELIIEEINNTINKLVGDKYIVENIYHIVISANTTMLHLLLGIDPRSLAKAPYRSVFLSIENIKTKDISIEANKEAILSIIPSASSYVGGDIVSGIMASDFQSNKKAIFIDIGTNGELAALKDGRIISTSTAAGPALEGMNIECGCRAQNGAIERFNIDENYNITYNTIGNEKPLGICGSGLIDIAGALVKRNILLKSGRWNKDLDDRVADKLIDKKFYITEEIYISQKDIRQIQLAKGAIATGLILMLEEIGTTIEEIPKAYIAGAFGYHVNPDNIKLIGLIPKGFNGEIRFLGNTSLEGSRLALINRTCLQKVNDIKEDIVVLELSLRDNFQDVFVRQLNF